MDHEISIVAEAAAHKAVAQTFALLGVDIYDQDSLNDLRDTLLHARKIQRLSERAGFMAAMAVVGAIVSGALAFMWAGFSGAFQR